jgi:heterodisulfide reductase subunit C
MSQSVVLFRDKTDRKHSAAVDVKKRDAIRSLGNDESFAIGTMTAGWVSSFVQPFEHCDLCELRVGSCAHRRHVRYSLKKVIPRVLHSPYFYSPIDSGT